MIPALTMSREAALMLGVLTQAQAYVLAATMSLAVLPKALMVQVEGEPDVWFWMVQPGAYSK